MRGSGVPALFTARRSAEDHKTFPLFRGVDIDGVPLDPACYSATEGSVRLSVLAEYMETLAEGTHSIRFRFEDGFAEEQFHVIGARNLSQNMTKVNAPQTAEETFPAALLAAFLFLYSLAGCVFFAGRRTR